MKYKKTADSVQNIPQKNELLEQFYQQWQTDEIVNIETIPLDEAENRVLAKDIQSQNTLPVYRSAKMDGIALCFDHLNDANCHLWKQDIDYCMADTGDDFSDSFDTVVPIEAIDILSDGGIVFQNGAREAIEKGQCINSTGSTLQKQEPLISAGTVLNTLQLNLLAMGGHITVPVIFKPRIVYIPTGSELISAGIPPKRNENIESNSFMVRHMTQSWGANLITYPICKDIQSDLSILLDQALTEADIILINGGSSKGSEDFNTKLIQERASFFQHYVRSAPGFPVGIGLIDNHPVINLPGPPTATFAVMHWLVHSLLQHMLLVKNPMQKITYAKLTEELIGSDIMDLYIYARIEKQNNELWITPMSRQTRTIKTLGTCNAVIILPSQAKHQVGEMIEAEWI